MPINWAPNVHSRSVSNRASRSHILSFVSESADASGQAAESSKSAR